MLLECAAFSAKIRGAMLFLAMWLDLLEEAIVFLQGKHSIRQIMGSIYPLNYTQQKRSNRKGSA